MSRVLEFAKRLIAAPSVTPARGQVFDAMEAMLAPLGFAVHRFIAGEGEEGSEDAPVENLFAIRHGPPGSRHFAFAGHLDVVPPGEGWSSAPFAPEVRPNPGGDLLYGRGAVDMKGAIAAMVTAVSDVPQGAGTLSFIVTGDEEGPAQHGTRALIDHMRAVGDIPDLCLVGEPTSVHRLGDMMKIGRRGSTILWIEVEGREGHVAYPHLADNPIPRLMAMLGALIDKPLDDGTPHFQPSSLQVTTIDVGNPATNVIPGSAKATFNIRFNDIHTPDSLTAWVRETCDRVCGGDAGLYDLRFAVSGDAFVTPPGALSALISDAVQAETGRTPELSTSGGTSDARFIKDACAVVEFGLVGQSMHKKDENVRLDDLEALTRIYRRVIDGFFS